MRVACVAFSYAEYAVRLAAAIREYSDCVPLLIMPRQRLQGLEHLVAPEVVLHDIDLPRLRQPLRQLLMIRQVRKVIDAFQPDVVHFQGAHLWFNMALPWIRRRPLVITAHDVRHHLGDRASRKTPQWVMDWGFRQADHLIVHGEALREQLNHYLSIPGERVTVCPMVVQGESAPGLEPLVPEEPHTILFFGRIWPYKGLDVLIEAAPRIQAAFPDARIVIGGEGEGFERYAAQMHDPEMFEVHNAYVSNALREQLFRRAAVVVLPYREATQSGVIPVAYSYGKPVVASRVGAIPEAVLEGRTGILVPPANPAALAAAVIRMLSDPARRARMGAEARQYLDEQASMPRIVAAHRQAYEQAITARNQP
ncbi:MAG: glycosyltransferase family 1 protein [Planctomycetota bacterium]|nr:MAG: glycosyltransferase family 1 protein [Planctomycetota bacterium]